MNTKTLSLVATTVAAVTGSVAHAGLIIPTSASQVVSASASLYESPNSDSDTDSDSSVLPASFTGNAEVALGAPFRGSATATGDISSLFGVDAISVSGSASCVTQSGGLTGDTADASASSWFTFTFEVSEPANYVVGGWMMASGFGSISGTASLTEDGTGLFNYTESDNSFSDSGLLSPGKTYVLAATADAMSYDMSGFGDTTAASFGFEFSVTPVPEPQSWVFLAGLGLAAFAASRRSRG